MFSETHFFLLLVCVCTFDMQTYVRQELQILRIRIKPNRFQLEGAAPHQIFLKSPSQEDLKGPRLSPYPLVCMNKRRFHGDENSCPDLLRQ